MGWFICIVSARQNLEALALLLCMALVGAHFFFSQTRLQDFKLSLICLGVGVVLDSILQYWLIIDFYGWALGPLSPFWLWMVWILFGLTLNSSLSFLQTQHVLVSAFAGFIFGPLSYLAGSKLGAASFVNKFLSLGTLAFFWMITLPLLVLIGKHLYSHKEATHDAP